MRTTKTHKTKQKRWERKKKKTPKKGKDERVLQKWKPPAAFLVINFVGCFFVTLLFSCFISWDDKLPSKHARSDLHLTEIGSEVLARSGLDDSCTLACFQIRSVWPKPDVISQNPIRSRLVLHNMIQAVCGRMQPSHFSPLNCCLGVVLYLDKADYPEHSRAVFYPNK